MSAGGGAVEAEAAEVARTCGLPNLLPPGPPRELAGYADATCDVHGLVLHRTGDGEPVCVRCAAPVPALAWAVS